MSETHVLIVEDNEDTGAALTMLLEHAGYAVEWTRTAAETFSTMRQAQCPGHQKPDVMIMDLMLPDASGPALVERLNALGPVPPVILHSAAAEWVLNAAAEKLSAVATLRKPVEGKVLMNAIAAAATPATPAANGKHA